MLLIQKKNKKQKQNEKLESVESTNVLLISLHV